MVRACAFLLCITVANLAAFANAAGQMEHMLGASRLPLTVLVDANGRVLKKGYGARQWDGADALRLIDDAFRRMP